MLCGLWRLFLVSSLFYDFTVVGFYYSFLTLFLFFSCFLWYRCAELVFWSFFLFYRELCVSSLEWAPCLFLFSLWGVSYLFASGCASSTLGKYLPPSWWLWPSDYSSPSGPLSWFFALVLVRTYFFWGIALFQILSFFIFFYLF